MLLSIVIPSHNKVDLLNSAIDSITSDKEFGKNTKLVISDNSLGSDIFNLYKSKFKKNKFVEYFDSRNHKCLDSNVNRSIQLASSEYAWVFGDDDLLVNGVIGKITKFLKTKKPDLLVLNSQTFTRKGIIEKTRMPRSTKSIYKKNENDKFLSDLGGYLTYVGSIIVKKKLWIENFNSKKIGSFFAHIDCIASIKNNRKVYFYNKPAIMMRLGSQTWLDKSFQIWYLFYPEIIWGLKNYSINSKQNVVLRNPLNSIKCMAAARAYKRIDLEIFKKFILSSHNVSFINKIIIFFIAILPVFIFKKIYLIYIFLFRNIQTSKFSPELAKAQLNKKNNNRNY